MAKLIIDGIHHELPAFALGDAILVHAATGVAVEDLDDAPESVQVLALAAVAIRRANPDWSREKVVKAAEKIEQLDFIADPDANPQAAAASESSQTASDGSTITPDLSDEMEATAAPV